jgi:signal transduction histidine kinase
VICQAVEIDRLIRMTNELMALSRTDELMNSGA